MAYAGQVYLIPCDRGGHNYNSNIDLIPPTAMVMTRNINLHHGAREKRGGTSKVNETAITGTPEITGLYQFIKRDGEKYIIVGANDGKVYADYTTELKTGLAATGVPMFETMDNALFVCNGVDLPFMTDGAIATDMTDIPADWTGTNFPKMLVNHSKGNSRRLWALGFADGSCYASKNNDGTDFGDANVVKIPLSINDGYGTLGGFEWGGRLFACGKWKTFLIDDTDAATSNWGYEEAIWENGVGSPRLIVKTPVDVHLFTEAGDVYSVSQAQEYGDYKMASVARPAFMDRYIRTYMDLSKIDKFHGTYDPVLRCVKWFCCRKGVSYNDVCLVYFIDRPPAEAWVVHDSQTAAGGYRASCSALVQKSIGTSVIYTGDYAGRVWELETVNRNDGGVGYYGGFRLPYLSVDNPRFAKLFDKGRIICTPSGDYNLQINMWVDGANAGSATAHMGGVGSILGALLLGTDRLGGEQLIDSPFTVGVVGRRVQLEFYNTGINQSFSVSQLLLDLKMMQSE
jgi:hypothetical protein